MPAQVTNYKCPSCTGPLHFEGSSGKLECEFCGSVFEVSEIEALYAGKDQEAEEAYHQAQEHASNSDGESGWDTSGMSGNWGAEASSMKVYNCPSCGAELICDHATAATSCPYCGNPTVVPGQFSGGLKPEFVVPFKLNKEAAIAALKKHYKGKIFLPRAFQTDNHIQEIKGVYVPFWLFDGEADADIVFDATISHTYQRGDDEVTETKHYDVHRVGSLAFEKVPADASTKMPDDLMDSIEPFDYQDLKPFSTAYLPGYLADRYDVSVEDSQERVNLRCVNSAVQSMTETVVGYQTCTIKHQNVQLRRGKVHYALLPVWILNTRWKNKTFLFAMNGQTGKLAGNLPVSWAKFWGLFGAIYVTTAALAWLIFGR